MATRSEKKYAVLVKQLTTRAGVEAGKMFGMPCVKVKGNVFVGLLKDAMFFKLSDEARVAAMKIKGARLFVHRWSGRPMKEWVQIPSAQSAKWKTFSEKAFEHVVKMPAK